MSKKRRQHNPEFKAKVALEALKGIEPIQTLAKKYQIHPTQITQWKLELLAQLPAIFSRKGIPDPAEAEAREARMLQKIGQLDMELDWLKKNLRSSMAERRQMLEPDHPKLSTKRQCRLLGLPRSTAYHRPKPTPPSTLKLMRQIDEVHLANPEFGSRQMLRWLRRQGYKVNRKRVRRLMQLMGIEAIYRKPNLSRPQAGQQIYPYLLRRLAVTRPNQVWATDITYVPIEGGYIYLCAVIDWYSRAVLAWELSNTLDAGFCVRTVQRALARYGTPDIFNTDQGSQFTSAEFTTQLKSHGIKISMDGKGRCLDNVFVERLWRTLKYDEIYLKSYRSQIEAQTNLTDFIRFYNEQRPHSAHDAAGKHFTPMEVYRRDLAQPLSA